MCTPASSGSGPPTYNTHPKHKKGGKQKKGGSKRSPKTYAYHSYDVNEEERVKERNRAEKAATKSAKATARKAKKGWQPAAASTKEFH